MCRSRVRDAQNLNSPKRVYVARIVIHLKDAKLVV